MVIAFVLIYAHFLLDTIPYYYEKANLYPLLTVYTFQEQFSLNVGYKITK